MTDVHPIPDEDLRWRRIRRDRQVCRRDDHAPDDQAQRVRHPRRAAPREKPPRPPRGSPPLAPDSSPLTQHTTRLAGFLSSVGYSRRQWLAGKCSSTPVKVSAPVRVRDRSAPRPTRTFLTSLPSRARRRPLACPSRSSKTTTRWISIRSSVSSKSIVGGSPYPPWLPMGKASRSRRAMRRLTSRCSSRHQRFFLEKMEGTFFGGCQGLANREKERCVVEYATWRYTSASAILNCNE